MRTGRNRHQLVVRTLSARSTVGELQFGPLRCRCALGRTGCRVLKREGDGATPSGEWPVREVFFRPERLRRPKTQLPLRAIARSDGWCDAPRDRNYNRRVVHPYPASAEHLWRTDGLYDIVVVLGYNDAPRIDGRGSAIFLHCAWDDYAPTRGCIAVRRADLFRLLPYLNRKMTLRIP